MHSQGSPSSAFILIPVWGALATLNTTGDGLETNMNGIIRFVNVAVGSSRFQYVRICYDTYFLAAGYEKESEEKSGRNLNEIGAARGDPISYPTFTSRNVLILMKWSLLECK